MIACLPMDARCESFLFGIFFSPGAERQNAYLATWQCRYHIMSKEFYSSKLRTDTNKKHSYIEPESW